LATGSGSDIDKVLTARLKPLQDQLAAISAERERLNRELREKQVSAAVLAASLCGLLPLLPSRGSAAGYYAPIRLPDHPRALLVVAPPFLLGPRS
jgi:hypothetical protein